MLSKNLIAASGNAGGESYWIGTYSGAPTNKPEEIAKIATDDQGNIYAVGYHRPHPSSSNYTNYGLLMKISKSGDILWSHTPIGRFYDVAVLSNGDVVFVGEYNNYGYTIKYNSSGVRLFSKRFRDTQPDAYARARHVEVDSNDNIFVIGGGGDYNKFYHYIQKLDSNGNHQLTRYDQTFYHVDTFLIDSQDNIIMSGYYTGDGLVTKYSSNLNLVWKKQYSDYSNNMTSRMRGMAIDSNDDIYIAHRMRNYANGWRTGNLIKINKDNGGVLWKTGRDSSDGLNQLLGVQVASNGDIYTISTGAKVAKYNSSGTFINCHTYSITSIDLRYMYIDSEDNLYITGEYSPSGSEDCFIIKVPTDEQPLGTFGPLTISTHTSSYPRDHVVQLNNGQGTWRATILQSNSSSNLGNYGTTISQTINEIEV